jgi:hypothetical protein
VQEATQQVYIAKNPTQTKKPSPNPNMYGSWITRETMERWIDPNGSNPRSYGYERKPGETRMNRTGSGAYKTPNLPVQFISYVHFSLFPHPLSLLSKNPNLAGNWGGRWRTAEEDEDSSESSSSPTI